MPEPSSQFVMSTELECLTSVQASNGCSGVWADRFFELMRTLAPTLPGISGIFNGYGRLYVDCGHMELALTECDSPYTLALVAERQQRLVRQAVERLQEEGLRLLLANNNHSGYLGAESPIWGSHENYLTERHPSQFGEMILPFLTTRIYAGAGGIEYPHGHFLAAVRPLRMELATGGGTTERRAIHSTAREEHHMGPGSNRYRYHLILGDGHRSQFNLALQFGATALALKAVFFDERLAGDLRRIGAFPPAGSWVGLLQRLNVLAPDGQGLRIDPLILQTQRVYLAAARRYVDSLREVPEWVPHVLRDWDQTLTAIQRLDRSWLAARLDAFIKYEFYSAVLQEMGESWAALPSHRQLFNELALLDHSYHEFSNSQSVFDRLERAGMLRQRVSGQTEPGREPEPFVPQTNTRAAARARFIRQNAGRGNFVVDWSWVYDTQTDKRQALLDPFAQQYEQWQQQSPRRSPRPRCRLPHTRELFDEVTRAYDRGDYDRAHRMLCLIQTMIGMLDEASRIQYERYQVWVQARRGFTDMDLRLASLHGGNPGDLCAVDDYCVAFRFRGLVPARGIQPWIERGLELLSQPAGTRGNAAEAAVFREHAGTALLKQGRPEEARELLEVASQPARLRRVPRRPQARILSTIGEIHRVLGSRDEAQLFLHRAERLQREGNFWGELSDLTLPSLAKLESDRRSALDLIRQAKELQSQQQNRIGLARSLLLESRLGRDRQLADANRATVLELRQSRPALVECPLLAKLLENWNSWVAGETLEGEVDDFWWV